MFLSISDPSHLPELVRSASAGVVVSGLLRLDVSVRPMAGTESRLDYCRWTNGGDRRCLHAFLARPTIIIYKQSLVSAYSTIECTLRMCNNTITISNGDRELRRLHLRSQASGFGATFSTPNLAIELP